MCSRLDTAPQLVSLVHKGFAVSYITGFCCMNDSRAVHMSCPVCTVEQMVVCIDPNMHMRDAQEVLINVPEASAALQTDCSNCAH